jgi:hypothetical protein
MKQPKHRNFLCVISTEGYMVLLHPHPVAVDFVVAIGGSLVVQNN